MSGTRRALVVVGGSTGSSHAHVEHGEAVAGMLLAQGFEVEWCTSAEPYGDAARLARADLVVDVARTSILGSDELAGLRAAVLAGTGLAGWPGGVVEGFWAEHPDAPGAPDGLRAAEYGLGRVVVADPGVSLAELDAPAARRAVEAGLLWAAAPATA